MPIWTFRCRDCGATTDLRFPTYDASVKNASCPHCYSQDVERIPSAPGFVINGYNAKNGYSK
jgi:putative FmdB family regulatory protein